MIIIDNYDSFTYNLVEYFKIMGINPIIFKNDEINLKDLKKINFERIVISPGWGNPKNSGISMNILKEYQSSKKILGVCLGHQCIYNFFGGKIVKAKKPMHGKISDIYITKKDAIFKSIPERFKAVRYHSLIADNTYIPDNIEILAKTKENEIMAIKHKLFPIWGIQFHPEAILTEYGMQILNNFINL